MSVAKETLGFQTEVKQLLHLMIHSLYSNKEIFLRELISNAADKLRFRSPGQSSCSRGAELKIRVSFDKEANTVTLEDNGIGMSREGCGDSPGHHRQVRDRRLPEELVWRPEEDSHLIGQFGVGFYSAFIVADKVDVYSPSRRPAGQRACTGRRRARGVRRRHHRQARARHPIEKGRGGVRRWLAPAQRDQKYSDHIAPIELPRNSTAKRPTSRPSRNGKRSTAPVRCGPVRAPR